MDIALAPTTRKWAVVTLVLALLYLPLAAYNLFQLPQSPFVAAGRGTLLREVGIEQLIIAAAFVIGSAALLRGKAWAYTWLGYSALAALATVVIGAYVQFALRGDAAVLDAFVAVMQKNAPQLASMPEEQLRSTAKMQLGVMFWFGTLIAAIQAAYCAGLYVHMAEGARRAEA